jgi:hypothetical protein
MVIEMRHVLGQHSLAEGSVAELPLTSSIPRARAAGKTSLLKGMFARDNMFTIR